MKTYAFRDEGWKDDFKKLFKYLKERYRSKRVFYFAGEDEKNIKQHNFYRLFNYYRIQKNKAVTTNAAASCFIGL